MSHDTENKQCQVCKGYLFEDDDIVICPVCGAPHHRDCWQTLGHCGLEADHGTDRQYNKRMAEEQADSEAESKNTETRVCGHCGRASNSHEGDFCPYCGQPYGSAAPHTPNGAGPHVFVGGMPFNPNSYGGIPKDSKIEDVKVEHAAKFVGSNAQRYIPRFATLTRHSKGSWNWAAFLSPEAWCFSRKMYLYGVFYLFIALASGLCIYPFQVEYSRLISESAEQVYSSYNFLVNNVGAFSWTAWIMAAAGVVLNLIPRIICGRMGDWCYRGFTLENVRKITADPNTEDLDLKLTRSGNLNIFAMMLVLLAVNYVPSLIGGLIW